MMIFILFINGQFGQILARKLLLVPPGKGYHGSKLQLSGALLTLMSGHNESLAETDGPNKGLSLCVLGLILAEGLSSQFSSQGQQSQKRQNQETN